MWTESWERLDRSHWLSYSTTWFHRWTSPALSIYTLKVFLSFPKKLFSFFCCSHSWSSFYIIRLRPFIPDTFKPFFWFVFHPLLFRLCPFYALPLSPFLSNHADTNHIFSSTSRGIQLPSSECLDCSLRVAQSASEISPDTVFYSCATVNILKSSYNGLNNSFFGNSKTNG